MNKITLGLAPIGKFVFSHEDAIKQKKIIQNNLKNLDINFVDLDNVLLGDDGIIRDQSHVEPTLKYLQGKVDALFIPHCNFGTEGAAAMLTKNLGLPTLLWGPRDEAPLPDGSRFRDSLCGMLASSKVMTKLVGNKFTYIENCHINDNAFINGLDTFLRASSVVKTARNIRIGLIGARIDFFWSCIVNESELLEKYNIQVIPFEIATILKKINNKIKDCFDTLGLQLKELKDSWLDPSGIPDEQLIKGIAAAEVLVDIKNEHKLSSIAVQNFFSLAEALEGGAALYPVLANEQVPLADESDIHGAISSVLIDAAKKTELPVFFPEYVIRHPEDDDSVCMWHVGAPASLRDSSCEKLTIMPPWILPGDKPIQMQMKLRNGPLTVCRFDGETGNYRLGVGQGDIIDGLYTRDYYGWFKVNNWKRWEYQLIHGPYIHHCSAAYGHCADALIEACKYLDIEIEEYGK